MDSYKDFLKVMRQTKVLRFPRHRLATFGSSEIEYSVVSPVSSSPPKANLRTGRVTAQRPQILSPEMFRRRFEGFGEDAEKFAGWLMENFQEAFRALQYNFQNKLDGTIPHSLTARELAENIKRDLDGRDVSRAAVILGPNEGWQFSVMRFILEETSQSFPANMRELDERGLFDPEQAAQNARRREIERLFQESRFDSARLSTLGAKLKDYGLFEEYQDRFFRLVSHSSH